VSEEPAHGGASAGPVLEAQGIGRSFGKVTAVRALDLALLPGRIHGLVGPDGAGKTTTIRMLAGLLTPDHGRVLLLGRPLRGDAAQRSALGYMPQAYSLYADLSVEENLRFFADLAGLRRAEYRERRRRLLQITRLEPFSGRRAGALSGGMYKKLALACSLLHRPRVLLLDEPTNGVDPISRRELWALLHELAAEGTAILISTPYMDEAERCSWVGLIDHGAFILQGEPRRLIAEAAHAAVRVLGAPRAAVEAALEGWPGLLAA